jgi:hypothetical protein
MPVAFLTEDQIRTYGTFPDTIEPFELAQFFYLDAKDWQLLTPRRGAHNRLGVSVQLCTVRHLGTFLTDVRTAPAKVVHYLAKQLNNDDAHASLERYHHGKERWEHLAEISEHYGYHEYGNEQMAFAFLRMLFTRCWTTVERPSVLFDAAVSWLRTHQVLLPGITTIERTIAQIRDRVAERLWSMMGHLLTDEQRERLEQILSFEVDKKGNRVSRLEALRRNQRRTTAPALLRALDRLEQARAVGVETVDLSAIPVRRIKSLADYAVTSKLATIAELADDRRLATLLVLQPHLLKAGGTTLDMGTFCACLVASSPA